MKHSACNALRMHAALLPLCAAAMAQTPADYPARQGMNPCITSTDKLAAMIKAELTKWAKVIKTANIKLDN